jgi:regulator of protease activity HflC (stomatin/prohibitin superfamily)
MVGLIFGIIFIIAGIGVGFSFYFSTKIAYATDASGHYTYDANGNRVTITKHPLRKFTLLVVIAGILLGILATGLGCIASVDTGHVGIVRTFGKVEDFTFDSGMHFKAPWNSVVQMDNRVQKTTIELPCFSSDIQEVNTVYTVNYQISKTNAQNLYRDVGTGYLETVVNPTIQETVKTVIARYTAEDLIAKRAEVAVEIEELLTTNLQKYNIDVASTAIENMDFTDSFTAAVEAKAVAAQNKLQAQIEQDKLTMEATQAAERAKVEAAAQAEVNKINATAQAEVAEIQAKADQEVAKIGADSAEYQGKKEAAIALQRLASINGWTVVTETIDDTEIHTLYKANGEKVNNEELAVGTQKLIEYYYTQAWDGKLPDTFVGDGDISNIIIGNN